MSKKTLVISPKTERNLRLMGEQIKFARLRRNLSTSLIAERADITRVTLTKIEQGSPTVSIGAYAKVLMSIGNLDNDLLLVAKDDVAGRAYQDLNMNVPKRSRKKWTIK